MMRCNVALLLMAVFSLTCCALKPCNMQLQQPSTIKPIPPGIYHLEVVATSGSRKGKRVTGTLWLQQTSLQDRSPRTGEGPPIDEDRSRFPLFGWLDAQLQNVGAPCYGDAIGSSRDPIYPGVLGISSPQAGDGSLSELVLVIDTASNERRRITDVDGSCIGLYVQHTAAYGFAGTWRNWGIFVDGSGCFTASRKG